MRVCKVRGPVSTTLQKDSHTSADSLLPIDLGRQASHTVGDTVITIPFSPSQPVVDRFGPQGATVPRFLIRIELAPWDSTYVLRIQLTLGCHSDGVVWTVACKEPHGRIGSHKLCCRASALLNTPSCLC